MTNDESAAGGWSHRKPEDPSKRIGVYQSLSDVPRAKRLENQARKDDYGDLWGEWLGFRIVDKDLSDSTIRAVETVEKRWKGFMKEQGRHHAFPDPEHVEQFFVEQLERMSMDQAYSPYWTSLESFFWFLHDRTAYPHLYHPPLMAAVNFPTARSLFEYKLNTKE